MRARKKPPVWFRWAVWGGILLAVAVPTACVMNHGEVPGYRALSELAR